MSAEKQSARFTSESKDAVEATALSPSDQRADAILDRWGSVIPEIEWDVQASLIERIRRLKKQRKAAILAHNYQMPEIEFVRPCNLCPHMKLITLPKIAQALEALEPQVEVPAAIAERARQPLQAMLGASR